MPPTGLLSHVVTQARTHEDVAGVAAKYKLAETLVGVMADDRLEETETLLKRLSVFERLCQSPAHVRDLVDETGQSRSTVSRALNELEALDMLERDETGFGPTPSGRLVRDRLEAFLADCDDIHAAAEVLEPLPADAGIDTDVVAGSDAVLGTGHAPYRAAERIQADLREATRYRALLPALEDTRHVRLLYEHVVTDANPAELVVSPAVFRTLREAFPRRMAAMSEQVGFTIAVGEAPAYGLALLESEDDTTVHVVVRNESGSIHGLLANRSPRALRWGERRYDAYRREAVDRTDALTPDPDGGLVAFDADPDVLRPGGTLAVSLEREGFVRVDRTYFRDEPVADPQTAWREGLSLAEVHTGYAIDRMQPEAGADGDGQERRFAASIVATAEEGTHCLVLGPPGSGKSTACKQVIAEWYENGRGPILYREAGRGRAVGSIEALVETAREPGHTLVVVEDAARPDSAAVFEAIDRVGSRDDVTFLLDAREDEWRQLEAAAVPDDLEIVHVPTVDEPECERLIEHVELTTGRSIGRRADELLADVHGEASAGGDGGPNELLRLTHQLATYADPLRDGPTALETAVATLADELSGPTLDVCTLANVLNAAGVEVDVGLLYAVADPDEFDAVDAALERLEGHVLFARGGGYRTVHEEWSTAFLACLADAEGERARRRFGDVVTGLLALADEPERCDRIAAHRDDPLALATVTDDPMGWATEVVDAIHTLGEKRPKLAPLFGVTPEPSVRLPAVCSPETVARCVRYRGQMSLERGDPVRARAEFEALDTLAESFDGERALQFRVDALLGRGKVADRNGEYETAATVLAQALESARELGDPSRETRCLECLGEIHWDAGEYEMATELLESGLEVANASGDQRRVASCLRYLGKVARSQSALDRSIEYFERSADAFDRVGDRRGEAKALNGLGLALKKRGAYDEARERFQRSLETREAIGDEYGRAACLNNLGLMERRKGRHAVAGEHFEEALEGFRRTSDAKAEAIVLKNLGAVALTNGDLEGAAERYRQSLAIRERIGDRWGQASARHALGTVATDRGEHERARDHLERSLELFVDLGDGRRQAECHEALAALANREDDHQHAREHYERALALAREVGADDLEAKYLGLLGCVDLSSDLAAGRARRDESLAALDALGVVSSELAVVRSHLERELELGNEAEARALCERARERLALAEGVDRERERIETLCRAVSE